MVLLLQPSASDSRTVINTKPLNS